MSLESDPFAKHNYTPEKLQRLLADCINHRSPLKDLQLVVHAGADPNDVVVKGLRPIHYAAHENNKEALSFLLSFGVLVNESDDNGYTALHFAAKAGHYEICKTLLDHGAVINFVDGDLKTSATSQKLSELSINPLNLAIENDRPKVVRLLLEHGANPNTKYFLGYEINLIPPDHIECLKCLLEFGADPNVLHRGGLTILMRCCKIQCVEAVKVLLEYGAEVNFQSPSPFDQRTALHFAALCGNVEITKCLLDAGARTSRGEYEHSPLEFSITQDKLEVCKLLLEYGADPNEVNGERCSPLQVACTTLRTMHQKAIIQLLLEHGADPKFISQYYSYVGASLTPLVEYLSYQDDYDIGIIRLLLEYGASVNMATPTKLFRIKDGGGILQHVRKLRPHDDIFMLLLEASKTFETDTIEKSSFLSNRQKEYLLEASQAPRPLRHLTRLAIRESLRCPVKPKIDTLPLPALLKQYLLFSTKLEHVY